jgi:hypothetical protein
MADHEAIKTPVGDFQVYVDFLSRQEYDGTSVEQIVAAAKDTNRMFLFVVDRVSLAGPDRPILCVDLADQPGRAFRVTSTEMWSVENNLSLANMDLNDFSSSVDKDGVFRGLPQG